MSASSHDDLLNRAPTSSPHATLSAYTRLTDLMKIKKNLFRLIVDGHQHEHFFGYFGYAHKEPGCLPALFNAFEYAFTHLADPDLSVEMIQKTHELALSGVTLKTSATPGIFRTMPTCYRLFRLKKDEDNPARSNVTLDGLNALFKKMNTNYAVYGSCISIKEGDFLEKISVSPEAFCHGLNELTTSRPLEEVWHEIDTQEDRICALWRAPSPTHINTLLTDVIQTYNRNIKNANTDDEKLRLIVTCIQNIEQIHPFPDGNLRTCIVILQRLLIQNGFLPAMLFDPNCFDAYSVDELIEEVKTGIKNTRNIIDNPDHLLFGFTAYELDASIAATHGEMAQEIKISVDNAMKKFHGFITVNALLNETCSIITSCEDKNKKK